MYQIELGGIPVGIDNKYDLRRFFYGFRTGKAPFFTVSVTEEEIEAERKEQPYSSEYLEYVCAYRKIAEQLPDYDAFVFHGAAVALDGRAYLFTAPSGTGKTTHAGLWLRRYPEAWVVNGDKPVLRRIDGVFYACGTPWMGKENLGRPAIVPIQAVCLLRRGEENAIFPAAGTELATFLMRQIYRPKDPQRMLRQLALLDAFCARIPAYSLYCNTDLSAAELSYETMSGRRPAPERDP